MRAWNAITCLPLEFHGIGVRADPARRIVQRSDPLPIVVVELKVADREVCSNALRTGRFRNRDHTAFEVPSKYHLGDAALVFACDSTENSVLK